jgi:hypothetical protein
MLVARAFKPWKQVQIGTVAARRLPLHDALLKQTSLRDGRPVEFLQGLKTLATSSDRSAIQSVSEATSFSEREQAGGRKRHWKNETV